MNQLALTVEALVEGLGVPAAERRTHLASRRNTDRRERVISKLDRLFNR